MELKELVKRINKSDTWNPEDLKELCRLAGMEKEWENADGETFESVVYQTAERLGVDICDE